MCETPLQRALTEINVLHYRDYRLFLSDFYKILKRYHKRFSYRDFAEVLGFQASNFLHLVIQGKRKLSLKKVDAICTSFVFNEKEQRHFKLMVESDHIKTGQRRNEIVKSLVRHGAKPGTIQITKQQHRYFSEWYYPAIRELIALKGFVADPKWIAEHLCPQITPTQAKQALKTLLSLGLIRCDQEGNYHVTEQTLATPDEIQSDLVITYHKEMLQIAANSIDIVPSQKRDISAVTMSVDSQTADKVKHLIQDFRKQIQTVVAASPAGTEIMQLNMQWFPLTADIESDASETTAPKNEESPS